MKDIRLSKLADVLLDHSVKLKEGENLIIRSSNMARPLITELHNKAISRGANVFVHTLMADQIKYFIENASETQIQQRVEYFTKLYEDCHAFISIDAPENVKYLSNVPVDKNAGYNKIMGSISKLISSKKWVITNYPTEAFAQEAEMSLEEYEDMLFDAVLVDYEEMDRNMNKVLQIFDNAKTVRIKGRDTDLTFSIEGRKGIKCSGENNVPDGEVYYAPVTNSVNGHIYYEFPPIRYGVQADGVRLEFKDGKVINAKADKNADFLNKMLDTDEGARYIGEFGIGLNYGIKKFIKNILFDEKIGGTIHLAVGNSYEGSGGDNRSLIHWDMVKELRDNGEIYADGKLIMKNGLYLFD